MPEVGLVAILDADKEGFRAPEELAHPDDRSRCAQSARRARFCTRIMRAKSIKRALEGRAAVAASRSSSTRRMASRRAVFRRPSRTSWKARIRTARRSAALGGLPSRRAEYVSLTPERALRKIKKLEPEEMFKHARNLEFEDAARLRDEIQKLRNVELGPPPTAKAS